MTLEPHDVKRLWPMAQPHADGCLLWCRHVCAVGLGFGVFHVTATNTRILAHRAAWMAAHPGEDLPDSVAVIQTCGNRRCIRPEHLQLGTLGLRQTPAEKRFWRFVEKADGCWLWSGTLTATGYGRIGTGGEAGHMEYAHRFSWEMHHAPVPDGKYVSHHCDVRNCVNPDHLFLSDGNEGNMEDAAKKNRIAHGERSGLHTLSDADVAEIRRLRALKVPGAKIAAQFGTSRAYVYYLASPRCSVRQRPTTQYPEGLYAKETE